SPTPGAPVRGDEAPGALRRVGGTRARRAAASARHARAIRGVFRGGDDVVLDGGVAPIPPGSPAGSHGAVVRQVRPVARRTTPVLGGPRGTGCAPAARGSGIRGTRRCARAWNLL